MSLPEPPVALTGACAVIYDNTLYTYSADAFQALELSAGAEWTTLPQGEQVTGGVCVGSTPADPSTAGFFVVGGTAAANSSSDSSSSSSSNYQGLQKFTYATKQWESISLVTPVVQDRLNHGAVYINGSDAILVYAGAQDGSTGPSTQTFTIGASAPNEVLAYSSTAPPTISPILLPWSSTQAALLGGSATNTQIKLFDPATATWLDSGASLAFPLEKDTSSVQAMLMDGDDGSKSLYTFDMSVSPNIVNRTLLVDANGTPVQGAVPVAKRWAVNEEEEDDKREEKDERGIRRRASNTLTQQDWPPYNASLASTSTRTNYALASEPNGNVVIAGGGAADVLCVFNARSNAWLNATAMFADTKGGFVEATPFSALPSSTSSSSSIAASSSLPVSSTASSASVAAATSSSPAMVVAANPAPSSSGVTGTNTILGAILGSIFGLALILGLLYFCIRRQRKRQAHQEAGHARRASGKASSEKDAIVFASDSYHPQQQQQTSGGMSSMFRGGYHHQVQDSQSSFSSMAILMGRINQQKTTTTSPIGGGGGVVSPSSRNMGSSLSNPSRRDSGDSAYNKAFKSAISKPIPQEAVILSAEDGAQSTPPRSRDDKSVSFARGTVEPRPRNTALAAFRDADGVARRSSGWNRYWSGGSGSALSVLGFGNSGNNNNGGGSNSGKKRITTESESSQYSDTHRITQDSATVPPLNVYGGGGGGNRSPRASFSRVNSFSPTIAQFSGSQLREGMSGHIVGADEDRPVSPLSSRSGYSSGIPASVHENWDPTAAGSVPWGADRAPSSNYSSTNVYATPLAPASQQQQQQQPQRTAGGGGMPLGVSRQPQLAKAATSDMSWLNLGDHAHEDMRM